MIRLLLPFAATLPIVLAAPAVARDDGATVAVRYADLDLTRQAGQAALNHRVASAVAMVCGQADIRDLGRTAEMRRCRKAAAAAADPQIAMAVEGAKQMAAASSSAIRVAAR